MNLSGHFWTVWPSLRHRIAPLSAPPSVPWTTLIDDPRRGEVRLGGRWSPVAGSTSALVVLHGLGGGFDRPYSIRAARAASRRRMSCLRLAQRGADRSGQDFYHAGLIADLEAAVASPELATCDEIFVLGYSLGGHLALRYACGAPAPSVRAVAAVCPPLDLETTCQFLDGECFTGYRRHLLSGLIGIYAQVAASRPVPSPLDRVRRARRLREFDSLTVVPRFGFASAEDYYARESVGSRLASLARPALLCASVRDPILPPHLLRTALADPPSHLHVRWIKAGGHVSFPPGLDLGYDASRGLESQVLAWMQAQRADGEAPLQWRS